LKKYKMRDPTPGHGVEARRTTCPDKWKPKKGGRNWMGGGGDKEPRILRKRKA